MNKAFKPNALLTTITVSVFTLISFLAFRQGGAIVGVLILIVPGRSLAVFISGYEKFVVTPGSLRIVGFFGKIKREIPYSEMNQVFRHKSTGRAGQTMQVVDANYETLVIDLIDAPTERYDITPINNTDELMELLRKEIEEPTAF